MPAVQLNKWQSDVAISALFCLCLSAKSLNTKHIQCEGNLFPESLSHSSSDIRIVTCTDTSHPNYKVILISQFTDVWTSVSDFAINFLFVLKDICVMQITNRIVQIGSIQCVRKKLHDAEFEMMASLNKLQPELLCTSWTEI
jgi:hypothetical protein